MFINVSISFFLVPCDRGVVSADDEFNDDRVTVWDEDVTGDDDENDNEPTGTGKDSFGVTARAMNWPLVGER